MEEPLTPELKNELAESLLDAIQDFFDERLRVETVDPAEVGSGTAEIDKRARITDRQLQLATAVLLLEVARSDFDLRADEFRAITDGVQTILGLTEDESIAVVRFAEEEVRQSKRIYQFTQLVKQHYTPKQKKRVVRHLWQVAFADAQLLPSEEYVVRKIADLLGVPLADFLDAKIKARDAFR